MIGLIAMLQAAIMPPPPGLPMVLPIEARNCALDLPFDNDMAKSRKAVAKYFENGVLSVQLTLNEEEQYRKVDDLIVQMDDGWYAQGRGSLYRIESVDKDPTKASAPMLSLSFTGEAFDALASAKSLKIWNDWDVHEAFALDAVPAPKLQKWRECVGELKSSPGFVEANARGYRRQSPNQSLQPINRHGWLTSDDYPSRAVNREIEGIVDFTLEVSVNGRVRTCKLREPQRFADITRAASATDPMLLSSTCNTIRRRARFIPATDSSSRPLVSYWSGRVHYRLTHD